MATGASGCSAARATWSPTPTSISCLQTACAFEEASTQKGPNMGVTICSGPPKPKVKISFWSPFKIPRKRGVSCKKQGAHPCMNLRPSPRPGSLGVDFRAEALALVPGHTVHAHLPAGAGRCQADELGRPHSLSSTSALLGFGKAILANRVIFEHFILGEPRHFLGLASCSWHTFKSLGTFLGPLDRKRVCKLGWQRGYPSCSKRIDFSRSDPLVFLFGPLVQVPKSEPLVFLGPLGSPSRVFDWRLEMCTLDSCGAMDVSAIGVIGGFLRSCLATLHGCCSNLRQAKLIPSWCEV